jgi:CBS domain-containing protein
VPSEDEAAGEHADPAAGGGDAPRSVRIRDPGARALHAAHAAVVLRPEATFLRLLEALVGAHVHRAYVADENLTPLAVVTHTDVLAVLMRGHKPAH